MSKAMARRQKLNCTLSISTTSVCTHKPKKLTEQRGYVLFLNTPDRGCTSLKQAEYDDILKALS